MEDIAPKLYEKIKKEFDHKISDSKKLTTLSEKLAKGTATYKEAHEFAIESGGILSQVFQNNISSSVLPDGRLYYNIADRIIRPMMGDLYEGVADYAKDVQALLNKQQKIGIKAIKPELNEDKVQGIIDITSGKEHFDDIAYMLGDPLINFAQTIVDDAVRANADFQYKAGLSPKIIRTSTGKCCKWCDNLTGVYEYEEVSDTGNDVFRRHKHCRCLVEYDNGDGKRTNVHTKKIVDRKDSAVDLMGERKDYNFSTKRNGKNVNYHIRTQKIDRETNIYSQTYTKNAQEMIHTLKKKIQDDINFKNIDNIVIAKHSTLNAIAAYMQETNTFFICEELIESSQLKKLIDIDYFPARTLDDVLTHEIGGHKRHWEQAKKIMHEKGIALQDAKDILDVNLRTYVENQQKSDILYVRRMVSENAYCGFLKGNINELVADALVLIRQNRLKDPFLQKLVLEVLGYDD